MNEIIKSIIMANYHYGGMRISCLFRVDDDFMASIEKDVNALVAENEPSDVSKDGHVTNWTRPVGEALQYSLFNKSGKTNDTSDDHTRMQDGKKAIDYPAIKVLIEMLRPLGLMGMRLNYLGPDSGLSPHEEHITHRDGSKALVRVRFHLPVVTNDGAIVALDGQVFKMERGQVYFFNNGCVHEAMNHGSIGRYHIVWDMMLSKKCFEAMFASVGIGDVFVAKNDRSVKPIGITDHGNFESYEAEIETAEEAIEKFAFAQ